MAILRVREIGDPVLRTKAKKVDDINQKTEDLISNMIDTMLEKEGAGLAAPQVGVSKRIIVLRPGDIDSIKVVINPDILESEGKDVAEEGCLSIPENRGLVSRAEKIKVRGLNPEGQEFTETVEGLLARIYQHEIDHLNGVLFVDKELDLNQEMGIEN